MVQTVLLRFESEHARSYNELVEVRKPSDADSPALHDHVCLPASLCVCYRRAAMPGKGGFCSMTENLDNRLSCKYAHAWVQVIELNLLLADWYDENHRQSLLNKTNAKWAREMLYNTRCGTLPGLWPSSWQATGSCCIAVWRSPRLARVSRQVKSAVSKMHVASLCFVDVHRSNLDAGSRAAWRAR